MVLLEIKKGQKVSGLYKGCKFSGTITSLEADQSGYQGTHNDMRAWVTVDTNVLDSTGYVKREAGEELLIDCIIAKGKVIADNCPHSMVQDLKISA